MFCRHVIGNISGGFRVFFGISRDFAEIPEFHGSATAEKKEALIIQYSIGKKNYYSFI